MNIGRMFRRAPARIEGPGIAGGPLFWPPIRGVRWSYVWTWDTRWRHHVFPMLRSNATFSVKLAMTRGGLKNAVLFLNEPMAQEGCGLKCQVSFLHKYYPQVLHWNPQARIVWSNAAYPSAPWLRWQIDLYRQTFNAGFPDVDIGVHSYDRSAASILRFREQVWQMLPGARVVVTECGSMHGAAAHAEYIRTVVHDLLREGVPTAPFLWGRDPSAQFKHTSLGTSLGGLTPAGIAYRRVIASL